MGHNNPGAKSMWDVEKYQQYRKYFLQYSTFVPKRPLVRTWRRQTCSLSRVPSHSGSPPYVRHVLVRTSAGDVERPIAKLYHCLRKNWHHDFVRLHTTTAILLNCKKLKIPSRIDATIEWRKVMTRLFPIEQPCFDSTVYELHLRCCIGI